MNVLHISSGDLVGARFNGYDWKYPLSRYGIESKMLVHWNWNSDEPWVDGVSPMWTGNPIFRKASRALHQKSLSRGLETDRFPWSRDVLKHEFFKEADVVHLQIVQDGTLDLHTIRKILSLKPVVWTWHDFQPITGHCVYPMECHRYAKLKDGCGQCPDLNRPFKIGVDKTFENRRAKIALLDKTFVVHIASEWFMNQLRVSGIDQRIYAKLLPFGLEMPSIQMNRSSLRSKFGISSDSVVVGIRSVREPQKNFQYFLDCLERVPREFPMTVISIQERGMLDRYQDRFDIRYFDWSNDKEFINGLFAMMDVFVMPSKFETFGFMAVEAMSNGVPVVALPHTATSDVCDLSTTGFLSENWTTESFSEAFQRALYSHHERREKGRLAKLHVENNLNLDFFLSQLIKLYEAAIKLKLP